MTDTTQTQPADELADLRRQLDWWKAEALHYRDCAVGLMDAQGGSCAVLVVGQHETRLFAPTPDREAELMERLLASLREVFAVVGVKVKAPRQAGVSADEPTPE